MKKLLMAIFIGILILGLAGCQNQDSKETNIQDIEENTNGPKVMSKKINRLSYFS